MMSTGKVSALFWGSVLSSLRIEKTPETLESLTRLILPHMREDGQRTLLAELDRWRDGGYGKRERPWKVIVPVDEASWNALLVLGPGDTLAVKVSHVNDHLTFEETLWALFDLARRHFDEAARQFALHLTEPSRDMSAFACSGASLYQDLLDDGYQPSRALLSFYERYPYRDRKVFVETYKQVRDEGMSEAAEEILYGLVLDGMEIEAALKTAPLVAPRRETQ